MWWFQRIEWTLKSILHASNQGAIDTNYIKHILTRMDVRLEEMERRINAESKEAPGQPASRP